MHSLLLRSRGGGVRAAVLTNMLFDSIDKDPNARRGDELVDDGADGLAAGQRG